MGPKREAVRERLVQLVDALAPGAAIPAERTLAPELGVSRTTLRSAIDELVREGLLVRRQGSPTVVAQERERVAQPLRMVSFAEDMLSRGLTPSSRTLSFSTVPAGARLGRRLGVPPEAQVHRALRLRLADGVPIALETLHVPVDLLPGFTAADLEDPGLYAVLRTRGGTTVARGSQTIEPTVLEADEARLLEVPHHAPAFLFERSTCDATGRTVEFVRSLYRGDRYRLVAELVAPRAAAPARPRRPEQAGRRVHTPGARPLAGSEA